MKTTDLSAFKNLPYFTIAGFRQITSAEIGENDPSSDAHARISLNRWVKAGRLIQLKKGVYMHPDFYLSHRQDTAFSAVVSAILLPQSYLSLEYILQKHGILTEITYPVTAITLKNSHTVTNLLGAYVYRHIQPCFYQGFSITEAYGIATAQATPAKALFDYLYLRPLLANLHPKRYNLAEELRLNLEELPLVQRAEFAGFVAASGMPKMEKILQNLEFHIWRP